ncbi:MAG: 3,4-dihydroxy-2-butanone-4-phosphate synthase [Haloferacaceae archaeon]|jgi:3,4-dihydroxy-2-butanone 4-phosphate synthase (EC 4.1.2.-)|nr:3,4-dihydroxy-2-butanone-4-phosphate synthase [Haloferacaceae archaeon]
MSVSDQDVGGGVDAGVTALGRGEPVLVYDGADREGEVDIFLHADAATPAAIADIRTVAGGLVCVAIDAGSADRFGLGFLDAMIDHPAAAHRPAYDARDSFSLPVNHRETHTGVTDRDRAKTIRALGRLAADTGADEARFAATFRAPGHVPILRAAAGGLADRGGHTELAVAMATAAGVAPAVVISEMLDAQTGEALSTTAAADFATERGLVLLDSDAITDALG